jgi:hypothetical protein
MVIIASLKCLLIAIGIGGGAPQSCAQLETSAHEYKLIANREIRVKRMTSPI